MRIEGAKRGLKKLVEKQPFGKKIVDDVKKAKEWELGTEACLARKEEAAETLCSQPHLFHELSCSVMLYPLWLNPIYFANFHVLL
jgi:hypothetical protein